MDEKTRKFFVGSMPYQRLYINGTAAIVRGYFASSQARCAWCYDSRKTGGKWVAGSRRPFPQNLNSHGICPKCKEKLLSNMRKGV